MRTIGKLPFRWPNRYRGLNAERLEPRVMLAIDTPIISEFMASNESSLLDQFGRSRDWIEIYNPTSSPV